MQEKRVLFFGEFLLFCALLFVALPSKIATFIALLKEIPLYRQKKRRISFVLRSTFRNFASKNQISLNIDRETFHFGGR